MAVIGGVKTNESAGKAYIDLDAQVAKVSADLRAREVVWFKVKRPQDPHFMPEAAALVNPASFSERVRAVYAKDPVLGLSHEVLQYTRTESRTIPLDLYISWHIMVQKGLGTKIEDMLDWRNFFQSLVVPSALGLAPGLVKIIWPGAKLSFVGVVEDVDVTYEEFAPSGHPITYSISLAFTEIARKLMTAGVVRNRGLGDPSFGAE
jgi:hypothetical protein